MSLKLNPFETKKSEPIKRKKRIFDDPNEHISNLIVENNTNNKEDSKETIQSIETKCVKLIEDSKETIQSIETNYLKPILKIENKIEKQNRKNSLISTNKSFNFHSIVGLQQRVMLLIFEHCRLIGSKETNPIGISFFTDKLSISQLNAHNAINQLLKKGVIEKSEYKRGRGGYTRYLFTEEKWNIINLNVEKIALNYINKDIFKTVESETNSSSNNKEEIINTTIQVPENLKKIISRREIQKIIEKGLLTEDELSLSLEHFSYDIENNLVRAKTSPINLFFGLTRSGKTYKSLKLIQMENDEIQAYEIELKKLEIQKERLKKMQLVQKFNDYKKENPQFLELIREKNKIITNEEILNNLALAEYERINVT